MIFVVTTPTTPPKTTSRIGVISNTKQATRPIIKSTTDTTLTRLFLPNVITVCESYAQTIALMPVSADETIG